MARRQQKQQNTYDLALFAALLFAVLLALYGFGLGNVGIFDNEEAFIAQTSAELFASEQHTKPTFNGTTNITSPPLTFLAQEVSYKLFGVSELAARLPSAIAGFMLIFIFYNTIWMITGAKRYALIAASVLALNPMMLIMARLGTSDMLLTLFTISSTMMLIGNVYSSDRSYMRVIIAGMLAGAGFLTGGLIAFAIPFLVVGALATIKDHRSYNWGSFSPTIFLLSGLIAISPWFVMVVKEHGFEYLYTYVVSFAGDPKLWGLSIISGEIQRVPWWGYSTVLILGLFPWVLFFIAGSLGVVGNLFARLRGYDARLGIVAFGFVWFVVGVVLLFFFTNFNPFLIMMIAPGAALVIADFIERLPERPLSILHSVYIIPLIVIIGGMVLFLPQIPSILLGDSIFSESVNLMASRVDIALPLTNPLLIAILEQPVKWGLVPIVIGSLIIVGCLVGTYLMSLGGREAHLFIAGSMLMAFAIAILGVVPRIHEYKQEPLVWMANKVKQEYNHSTDSVVFFDIELPSVRFVSGIPYTRVNNPRAIIQTWGRKVFILTNVDKFAILSTFLPDSVERECLGGYCLATIYRNN